MNNADKIRAKWSRGELCVGTVVQFMDPAVTELYGEAGFDFVWIDLEHSPMSLTDAVGHVRAARGTDIAAFIRVPSRDPALVKPILELHPAAVIVPRIESLADAEAAVRACRYPPDGIRGFGPARGVRFGARDQGDYLEKAAAETMVILQIEHIDAVAEIDAILDVPGVDSIVPGQGDISGSMGLLGQASHPDVVAAVEEILRAAKRKGMPFGHSTGYDPETTPHWMEFGPSWIGVDGDWITLYKHAAELAANVRGLAGPGG